MPGVVLVNPHSGPDETSASDIAAELPGSKVHEIDGHDVKRQVQEAIRNADAPAFVAVAGGDGTIRCAAGVVVDTDLPLLPIPAGTRNHFAREVGIPTLDDAGRASRGEVRRIDVGEVNGEVFVNNANIGIYPRIVHDRDTHQKRFSKQTATLVATWQQVRSIHKFTVTVDGGESYRAWMVFVGNGRYGQSLLDLGDRESLDDGVLDVRILRADGKLARLRVALALLTGRVEESPMSVFDEVSEIELAFTRPEMDIALDGELLRLRTPLRFRCRAGALRVLVPTSEPKGLNAQPELLAANGRRFAGFAAAVLVFIVDPATRRFLLLSSPAKRARSGWEIVNGGLEAGETLLEGAAREVAEEAGPDVRIDVVGTVHAWTYHYDDEVPHMLSIAFAARYLGGEVVPGDDMAGSEAQWATIDEIRALATDDRTGLIPEEPWLFERAAVLVDLADGARS